VCRIDSSRILFNMILSRYIFDLKRHLRILKYFPGCAPYELHPKTKIIVFSQSKFRRLMYQGSHLVNLVTFLAMNYFLLVTNYDIFLMLFGLFVQVTYFTGLLVRWNLSCSSKFIDVFNQFVVFETKMNLKPNSQTGEIEQSLVSLLRLFYRKSYPYLNFRKLYA